MINLFIDRIKQDFDLKKSSLITRLKIIKI